MRLPIRPRARTFALTLLGLLLPLAVGCSSGSPSEPDGGSGVSLDSLEMQVLGLLNDARADNGLPALPMDPAAQQVARSHSQAMRDQNFFGHVAPDGSTLVNRLQAAGVAYRRASENLAVSSLTGDLAGRLHQILVTSPEHRTNMLEPDWDRVGIGIARSADRAWLTQVFIDR